LFTEPLPSDGCCKGCLLLACRPATGLHATLSLKIIALKFDKRYIFITIILHHLHHDHHYDMETAEFSQYSYRPRVERLGFDSQQCGYFLHIVEGRSDIAILRLVFCLAYSSALKMDGRQVAAKGQLTFKGLQVIIPQKTELFKYYFML
jgi:hypothetical protein